MNAEDYRRMVWENLKKVAVPDSRFHLNFSSYIPDFENGEFARQRLLKHNVYKDAETVFIAPDNCLEELRYQALVDGKEVIVPTYGIRRGFVHLSNTFVNPHYFELAATLDGMERLGKNLRLIDLRDKLSFINLMITGASAVSTVNGIRFGKGHGFFDLEWGIMSEIGCVTEKTYVVALVHNCQLIESEIPQSQTDSAVDLIFSTCGIYKIENAHKPSCGIVWEKLEPEMVDDIPVLTELKGLKGISEVFIRKEKSIKQ